MVFEGLVEGLLKRLSMVGLKLDISTSSNGRTYECYESRKGKRFKLIILENGTRSILLEGRKHKSFGQMSRLEWNDYLSNEEKPLTRRYLLYRTQKLMIAEHAATQQNPQGATLV